MAPDLSTTYLGLQLSSPLVPSASPLSRNLDTIRRLEDAGAAAIVLHSLFEEQIEFEGHLLDRYLNVSADSSYWEATSYHPEPDDFRLPPEQYLEHLRRAKAAAGIPIIASLNGISAGGWIKYARLIEQAGAMSLGEGADRACRQLDTVMLHQLLAGPRERDIRSKISQGALQGA